MNQVLHILRKDMRHLWIEILLSLAALIAYSAHAVYIWNENTFGDRNFWSIALPVLIPVTWWVLIVRLVQAETLVGDRQFWITRPYEWNKLVAAKAIIILLWISFPCYLAGVFLLLKAGFNPVHYGLGLLWMQFSLIVFPLISMMAVATVTRNITQSLLAALAIILFTAGMLGLDSLRPQSALSSGLDTDWPEGLLAVVASLLVIGLQYVRRKTALSRSLLVCMAVGVALIEFVMPRFLHGKLLFPPPAAGQASLFRMVLDPKRPPAPKEAPENNEDPIAIKLPIVAYGSSGNSVAQVSGMQLSLRSPDGFEWSSNWESYYPGLLLQETHGAPEFKIEKKIFDRFSVAPVKGSLAFALTIFTFNDRTEITAKAEEFLVPGVGRCRIDDNEVSRIICHSALQRPIVLMRAEAAASTCPPEEDSDEKQEPPPAGAMVYDWEYGSDGPYGIDPVESFRFYLSNYPLTARICPGTPLIFSLPKMTERTQIELPLTGFKLEDYREPKLRLFWTMPAARPRK